MSGAFQKRTTNIFLTIFIGFIVVSFMFTGYESMKGSPDTVANVGGIPIKISEYRQEYNRQLEFYRKIMNGELNSKQIEQFGLKQNAIRNLVQRNLMIKFSEKLGIIPSSDQIKKEIKDLPYFKTSNKFDINKYKLLLSRNGMTPSDFERDVTRNLKAQLSGEVIQSFPVSSRYVEEREKFKKQKVNANIVQFKKSSLEKHIKVTSKEIKTFLSDEKNKNRVEGIFKTKKATLDQKEQVLASHILFKSGDKNEAKAKKKAGDLVKKLNLKNFAKMADKHTEDRTGKGTGGDLKWFSKGRMVPEFEKAAFNGKKGTIVGPVKTDFGYHIIHIRDKKKAKQAVLADHQNNLAKELLQKDKKSQTKDLVANLKKQVEKSLKSKNLSSLKKLQKKYGFKLESDVEINRLDGASGGITIDAKNLKSLFTDKPGAIYNFDETLEVTIVKTSKAKADKKAKELDVEKERQSLAQLLSRKLREELMKDLEKNIQVKVYDKML
ncbi:MAG: SurA N-terminal domain-containing protein [Bacteriovoracaceae bacterium]|nr:SurA N-terminal domain-containing protein [Bacteriovoracaceae bacterium]